MQKFNVDVQRPSVPLVVYAKQQDTVRKVELTLYENGVPFVPPDGAVASVWFETPAGVGNYTDNITISGNKIELTLIEQMLTNAGNGIACVVLHDVDKAKLGLWNMEIIIEGVPALDSAVASEWFTALDDKISQALDAANRAEQAAASINPNDYLDTATYKGSAVGIVKESDDSKKLGGKLPNELPVNMDLLWENADLSSSFSAQTQTLKHPISGYKFLVIVFNLSIGGMVLPALILKPSEEGYMSAMYDVTYTRRVTTRETEVEFKDCFYIPKYQDGATPSEVLNRYIIPVHIIGIK